MAKFFARLVIDLDDGSVGLADSAGGEVQLHARTAQQGIPFSSIEIEELSEMNSYNNHL